MTESLFTFENMYRAWLDCRANKRRKPSALAFEIDAESNLIELTRELACRIWHPSRSICFIAKNDKHREVFAAEFRDRIVHHFLVSHLEKIWEPLFIYDSYACRKEKGTHSAIHRLQTFLGKVTHNNTRRAMYLQLDISSFFPSIDKNILLGLLFSRIDNEELRWLLSVLVRHEPQVNPAFKCSRKKWKQISPEKSLFSIQSGKGLPIGNLTSQFFANVYLNELDRYVKHKLKCKYYLRYVDDFVLLDVNRELLMAHLNSIESFLRDKLELKLHPERRILRPVSCGIDFLGYFVKPSHILIRNRTISRFKRRIEEYRDSMMTTGTAHNALFFPPGKYAEMQSTFASYIGILSHANTYGFINSVIRKYPFLDVLFCFRGYKMKRRWKTPKCHSLKEQYSFFRKRFGGRILFQVGKYIEMYDEDAVFGNDFIGLRLIHSRRGFSQRCGFYVSRLNAMLNKLETECVMLIKETGRVSGCIKERQAVYIKYQGRDLSYMKKEISEP